MKFNTYPVKASENAMEGYILNLNKTKGKCKNSIGVKTAIKLINRDPLNITFIKKIYAYLKRAKVYKGAKEKCGYISYQMWGGDQMRNWCEKILQK